MNIKLLIKLSMFCISMTCISVSNTASASTELSNNNAMSTQTKKITGRIVCESSKQAIPGATIVTSDKQNFTTTNAEGVFALTCSEGDVFNVSYLGYVGQAFTVTADDDYTILLKEDLINVEEVVVVGYGTQKKASVTGSIASIGGDEMMQTKNTNVQNALTGRVPGLRVVQKTSEPGSFNNDINIRGLGTPLIVIDGVIRGTMTRLDPNEIESLTILKDASAAIYGVKAANGVILITTKSGSTDGSINISYNGSMTMQLVSGMPENVSITDFMAMINEKSMTDVDGTGELTFPQEEIDQYLSGEKKATDWNDAVFGKYAAQTQHNVNVSGGNKKTNYFVNLGYQYQNSFLKSNDLNYDRFNLRVKLNTKITDDLTFDVNMSGIMDEKDSPYYSSNTIIRAAWKQFPYDPIYANDNEDYYYLPTTDETDNPVAMMDSDYVGYRKNKQKWFQSNASLTYDLPFIKGLSLKGMFSYDYTFSNNKTYKKEYNLYRYDGTTDTYNATKKETPSTVNRTFSESEKVTYQLSASFKRTFAEMHNVNAQLIVDGAKGSADNFYAQRELSIGLDELFAGNSEEQIGSMYNNNNDNPNRIYNDASLALIGRFNYDYKGKYLGEFVFRYDGSSRFREDERFGLFPSFSLGYRISEESFWQNSPLSIINDFKIRGSYGVMGDDGALRYQFLSGFTYPSGSSVFDDQLVNGMGESGIPNPNITWYTAKTMNFGFDFQMFNSKFGGTYDIFKRDREGLLATSEKTLPGTVGASLPQENINSDRTYGMELSLFYRNSVNDFNYHVGGNVAITRQMNLHKEETEQRGKYHDWRDSESDRFKNTWWGYGAGGQFENYDQIAEFDYKTGRGTMVSGYYYEDWNGDGFLDDNDKHPLGFTTNPLLTFGINTNLSYKGFDLDILLQGSAMGNVKYSEKLSDPIENVFPPLDFWADRWRPTDPNANPYSYYTEWIQGEYRHVAAGNVQPDSEYNVHSTNYIRLKNVELGYTLPKNALSRVGVKNLRVYISGYNLLTFSGLKFVDPEHPNSNNGYNYPLNKTVTLGLNLKF